MFDPGVSAPSPKPLRVEYIWSRTAWVQIGYGLWVNQVQVNIGLAFGFSAVSLPKMTTATMSQIAWIASVTPLSAPIGCVIAGYLLDRIGRKWCMVVCQIPMVLGWFIIGFATNNATIITGRALNGIGVGMSSAPPWTYCTEISTPHIRGVLGALPTLCMAFGLAIQATLGISMKWAQLCFFCGIFSVFLLVINLFLPETPYYVLMNGTMEETRRALIKFRAKDYVPADELNNMMAYKEKHDIRKMTSVDIIKNLFTERTCMTFAVIVIYFLAGQFSGVGILMFYTVDILSRARLNFNPYVGNMILCIIRFFSACALAVALFYLRRRTIAMIFIGLLSASCCLTSFVLLNSAEAYTIFPLFGFALYIIAATFAYYSLPLIMLFELSPLVIRGTLGGLGISLLNLITFIVGAMYPYVVGSIGLPGTLMIFGAVSIAGLIYLYHFLPETKGLTLQSIEERYSGHRNSLQRGSSVYILRKMKTHDGLHRQAILKATEDSDNEEEKAKAKLERGNTSTIRFKLPDNDEDDKENKEDKKNKEDKDAKKGGTET